MIHFSTLFEVQLDTKHAMVVQLQTELEFFFLTSSTSSTAQTNELSFSRSTCLSFSRSVSFSPDRASEQIHPICSPFFKLQIDTKYMFIV